MPFSAAQLDEQRAQAQRAHILKQYQRYHKLLPSQNPSDELLRTFANRYVERVVMLLNTSGENSTMPEGKEREFDSECQARGVTNVAGDNAQESGKKSAALTASLSSPPHHHHPSSGIRVGGINAAGIVAAPSTNASASSSATGAAAPIQSESQALSSTRRRHNTNPLLPPPLTIPPLISTRGTHYGEGMFSSAPPQYQVNLRLWTPKYKGKASVSLSIPPTTVYDNWSRFVAHCFEVCQGGAAENNTLYTSLGTPITKAEAFFTEYISAKRRHDARRQLRMLKWFDGLVSRDCERLMVAQQYPIVADDASSSNNNGSSSGGSASRKLLRPLAVVVKDEDLFAKHDSMPPTMMGVDDEVFALDVLCVEKGAGTAIADKKKRKLAGNETAEELAALGSGADGKNPDRFFTVTDPNLIDIIVKTFELPPLTGVTSVTGKRNNEGETGRREDGDSSASSSDIDDGEIAAAGSETLEAIYHISNPRQREVMLQKQLAKSITEDTFKLALQKNYHRDRFLFSRRLFANDDDVEITNDNLNRRKKVLVSCLDGEEAELDEANRRNRQHRKFRKKVKNEWSNNYATNLPLPINTKGEGNDGHAAQQQLAGLNNDIRAKVAKGGRGRRENGRLLVLQEVLQGPPSSSYSVPPLASNQKLLAHGFLQNRRSDSNTSSNAFGSFSSMANMAAPIPDLPPITDDTPTTVPDVNDVIGTDMLNEVERKANAVEARKEKALRFQEERVAKLMKKKIVFIPKPKKGARGGGNETIEYEEEDDDGSDSADSTLEDNGSFVTPAFSIGRSGNRITSAAKAGSRRSIPSGSEMALAAGGPIQNDTEQQIDKAKSFEKAGSFCFNQQGVAVQTADSSDEQKETTPDATAPHSSSSSPPPPQQRRSIVAFVERADTRQKPQQDADHNASFRKKVSARSRVVGVGFAGESGRDETIKDADNNLSPPSVSLSYSELMQKRRSSIKNPTYITAAELHPSIIAQIEVKFGSKGFPTLQNPYAGDGSGAGVSSNVHTAALTRDVFTMSALSSQFRDELLSAKDDGDFNRSVAPSSTTVASSFSSPAASYKPLAHLVQAHYQYSDPKVLRTFFIMYSTAASQANEKAGDTQKKKSNGHQNTNKSKASSNLLLGPSAVQRNFSLDRSSMSHPLPTLLQELLTEQLKADQQVMACIQFIASSSSSSSFNESLSATSDDRATNDKRPINQQQPHQVYLQKKLLFAVDAPLSWMLQRNGQKPNASRSSPALLRRQSAAIANTTATISLPMVKGGGNKGVPQGSSLPPPSRAMTRFQKYAELVLNRLHQIEQKRDLPSRPHTSERLGSFNGLNTIAALKKDATADKPDLPPKVEDSLLQYLAGGVRPLPGALQQQMALTSSALTTTSTIAAATVTEQNGSPLKVARMLQKKQQQQDVVIPNTGSKHTKEGDGEEDERHIDDLSIIRPHHEAEEGDHSPTPMATINSSGIAPAPPLPFAIAGSGERFNQTMALHKALFHHKKSHKLHHGCAPHEKGAFASTILAIRDGTERPKNKIKGLSPRLGRGEDSTSCSSEDDQYSAAHQKSDGGIDLSFIQNLTNTSSLAQQQHEKQQERFTNVIKKKSGGHAVESPNSKLITKQYVLVAHSDTIVPPHPSLVQKRREKGDSEGSDSITATTAAADSIEMATALPQQHHKRAQRRGGSASNTAMTHVSIDTPVTVHRDLLTDNKANQLALFSPSQQRKQHGQDRRNQNNATLSAKGGGDDAENENETEEVLIASPAEAKIEMTVDTPKETHTSHDFREEKRPKLSQSPSTPLAAYCRPLAMVKSGPIAADTVKQCNAVNAASFIKGANPTQTLLVAAKTVEGTTKGVNSSTAATSNFSDESFNKHTRKKTADHNHHDHDDESATTAATTPTATTESTHHDSTAASHAASPLHATATSTTTTGATTTTLPTGVVRDRQGRIVQVDGGLIAVGNIAVSKVSGELYRVEGFKCVAKEGREEKVRLREAREKQDIITALEREWRAKHPRVIFPPTTPPSPPPSSETTTTAPTPTPRLQDEPTLTEKEAKEHHQKKILQAFYAEVEKALTACHNEAVRTLLASDPIADDADCVLVAHCRRVVRATDPCLDHFVFPTLRSEQQGMVYPHGGHFLKFRNYWDRMLMLWNDDDMMMAGGEKTEGEGLQTAVREEQCQNEDGSSKAKEHDDPMTVADGAPTPAAHPLVLTFDDDSDNGARRKEEIKKGRKLVEREAAESEEDTNIANQQHAMSTLQQQEQRRNGIQQRARVLAEIHKFNGTALKSGGGGGSKTQSEDKQNGEKRDDYMNSHLPPPAETSHRSHPQRLESDQLEFESLFCSDGLFVDVWPLCMTMLHRRITFEANSKACREREEREYNQYDEEREREELEAAPLRLMLLEQKKQKQEQRQRERKLARANKHASVVSIITTGEPSAAAATPNPVDPISQPPPSANAVEESNSKVVERAEEDEDKMTEGGGATTIIMLPTQSPPVLPPTAAVFAIPLVRPPLERTYPDTHDMILSFVKKQQRDLKKLVTYLANALRFANGISDQNDVLKRFFIQAELLLMPSSHRVGIDISAVDASDFDISILRKSRRTLLTLSFASCNISNVAANTRSDGSMAASALAEIKTKWHQRIDAVLNATLALLGNTHHETAKEGDTSSKPATTDSSATAAAENLSRLLHDFSARVLPAHISHELTHSAPRFYVSPSVTFLTDECCDLIVNQLQPSNAEQSSLMWINLNFAFALRRVMAHYRRNCNDDGSIAHGRREEGRREASSSSNINVVNSSSTAENRKDGDVDIDDSAMISFKRVMEKDHVASVAMPTSNTACDEKNHSPHRSDLLTNMWEGGDGSENIRKENTSPSSKLSSVPCRASSPMGAYKPLQPLIEACITHEGEGNAEKKEMGNTMSLGHTCPQCGCGFSPTLFISNGTQRNDDEGAPIKSINMML